MKRSLLLPGLLAGILVQTTTLLAQDDTAAKVATAAAQKTSSINLLQLVQSGGWTMIPLGALSILALMLIIVYTFTLRRGAVVSAHFMNTAEELLKRQDYTALLAIANRHGEAVARVVRRTLDFITKNPSARFEIAREIAQTEGASQAASLQHRITYLADIAVLSPMVGLLGTVFGIIHSFGVIASNASQAQRPVLLAQGVSEALVATGTGLIVGIIAMGFYGLFRNRVQHLISELERASAHALGLLALHFEPKREESRREPRRDDYRDRDPGQSQRPQRRPSVSVDDEF